MSKEIKNVEYGLEKIFEGAQDFLPLLGTDYVEFYVGKIICLVTTILSTMYFIVIIVAVVVYQVGFSDIIENRLDQIKNQEVNDSIYLDEEIEGNYSNDSIYIDSTFVDSMRAEK